MPKIFIVATTFDNEAQCTEFANNMVKLGLCACCQISRVHSIYTWNSELNDEIEFKLVSKTLKKEELVEYIKNNHSYELPEIIIQEIETTEEYYNFVKGD